MFKVPVSVGHPDGGDLYPVAAVVDLDKKHCVRVGI